MFNTKKSPRKALSELEHLVMEHVWSHATVTADEVRAALARRRPLKDSTVRTILRRLEDKGYLRHTVEGRTYRYQGVEAPRKVAAGAVRQIMDRFCGGSLEQLLVGMVDNQVVDAAELRRLAAKIAASRRDRKE